MLAAVLAFAGIAAIANATPGLDMMLVLRTSVSGGRRAGLAAALGVNTGCLAWGLATAVGLSELLTASHGAFEVVRITGAVYLTWLGGSALWHSRRRSPHPGSAADDAPGGQPEPADEPGAADEPEPAGEPGAADEPGPAGEPGAAAPQGRRGAFRAGIGTNLLNPKAGVFYMSLLPQFIPHGAPVFGSTLLLTAVDLAELTVLYVAVSGAAAALSGRISRASFRRRMEQISGVVFLGFAASLVLDRG
jgi:threonine/homoserine/homoserine lactone efflux protein